MTSTPASKKKSKWNDRFVKMSVGDLSMSPLAFVLVAWLRRARDKEGKAYVDVARLTESLGCDRRTLLRHLASEKVAAVVTDRKTKIEDGREHWEFKVLPVTTKPFVRVSWAWIWPATAEGAQHTWVTVEGLSPDAVWAAACADRVQQGKKSFQVSVLWLSKDDQSPVKGLSVSRIQVRMRAAEAAGLITATGRKGGKRAAVREVHWVPVSERTVGGRVAPKRRAITGAATDEACDPFAVSPPIPWSGPGEPTAPVAAAATEVDCDPFAVSPPIARSNAGGSAATVADAAAEVDCDPFAVSPPIPGADISRPAATVGHDVTATRRHGWSSDWNADSGVADSPGSRPDVPRAPTGEADAPPTPDPKTADEHAAALTDWLSEVRHRKSIDFLSH